VIKETVTKAYEFAKKAHEGQKRKFTGVPYFVHPKNVARIIEDITGDETMVTVALLHDVVEDTEITLSEIQHVFGVTIAYYVNELTIDQEKREEFKNKTAYLIHTMSYMSDRAYTIKLADRLHNVMYLDKDVKTKEHVDFIKYYVKQTNDIIRAVTDIRYHPKDMPIINLIEAYVGYLSAKYNIELGV
jgi:(p)ppGpp synthase/HD superfamily hydrolase